MTPGWDDRDFTLGERASLLADFPAAAEWITRLTR
jgi:predicted cupin superfamily sugar epimerase